MRLRKIFKSGVFSVIFRGKTLVYSLLLILLFSFAIGNRMQKNYTPVDTASGAAAETDDAVSNTDSETKETLIFRSFDLLNEHFEKHGRDMGFTSTEEYLAAANEVVHNTASLHKQQSDGDEVYFLQETDDLVVVSTDGYIRTYFRPSDGIAYYNRQ
jgi:pyocin large subunit-like protein